MYVFPFLEGGGTEGLVRIPTLTHERSRIINLTHGSKDRALGLGQRLQRFNSLFTHSAQVSRVWHETNFSALILRSRVLRVNWAEVYVLTDWSCSPCKGCQSHSRRSVCNGSHPAGLHPGLSALAPEIFFQLSSTLTLLSLSHLLHVADHGGEFEPLALGVDGVQPAHQVLQEQLEDLRQAQHRLVPDHKGCNLFPTIVYNLAVIGRGVIWADHGWGGAGVRPSLGTQHPMQGEVWPRGREGGKVLWGGESGGKGRHAREAHGGPGEHGGHGDHG